MWFLLSGCGALPAPDTSGCDPRDLASNEVRARKIPCSDELIDGGEGRIGDWLLENAVARYVVRGPYAALGWLEEDGGSLIDAATPGGMDVLGEYLPDGDRSSIEAENGDGEATLVLPGVTYRLAADSPALSIEATGEGRLRAAFGAERTGATIRSDDAFFGVDGLPEGDGAVAWVTGTTAASIDPADLFDLEVDSDVDADSIVATTDGIERVRVPVVDGHVHTYVPTDATVTGERDGCTYDGLLPESCASLRIRVADDQDEDLDAELFDTTATWRVPKGGGILPIGPGARSLTLWAGPAWEAGNIDFDGKGSAALLLPRAMDTTGAVLAAFAEAVSPDADVADDAVAVAHRLAGEGVGFAVLLADDEVPTIDVDAHDPVLAVAGSRSAGWLWSWPWSPNSKKPAHGAVRWEGLSALDQLAVSEGGESAARRMIVNRDWVDAARAEADPVDWSPRPDGFWLDDLDDLDPFLALLRDWVAVAPVGPRTWIELDGADTNLPAVERGFLEGRTTAGTGPRLILTSLGRARGGWLVEVDAQAPRWAHLRTLTLTTPDTSVTFTIEGATAVKWVAPAGTTWVVASVSGDHATPGSDTPAWAVSAPLWP